MKKSRFTEARMIGVLHGQEADGPTGEVCRWPGSARRPSTAGGRNVGIPEGVGRTEAEGARGWETPAEEAPRRVDAGCGGAEGPAGEKRTGRASRAGRPCSAGWPGGVSPGGAARALIRADPGTHAPAAGTALFRLPAARHPPRPGRHLHEPEEAPGSSPGKGWPQPLGRYRRRKKSDIKPRGSRNDRVGRERVNGRLISAAPAGFCATAQPAESISSIRV